MTVYNGMFRCPGGQREPVGAADATGICSHCGRRLKRYTNGKVVMHKEFLSLPGRR